MRIRPLSRLVTVGLFLLGASLFAEAPHPPVSSTFDLIVLNRRFVSHIAFEITEGQYYLTLLVTHGPTPHAFHATPFPLHYACESPKSCVQEAERLDRHLQSGWNIALRLSGSTIDEIVYLQPPADAP